MTPETEDAFAAIRAVHGTDAITRVERKPESGGGGPRHALQKGAKWILPGLSATPWHDPCAHPELLPVVEAPESAHPAVREELNTARSARREAFSGYEHHLTRQEN
ncbi:hypothetical protein AB0I51_11765 [Streptomyces sp. NPDC050549]|uniref:hypothetical protein n=1 Tax=Streptomyces sp. NPDC050549 TaxID=3155406 RepID=UPI00342859DC